MLSSKMTTFEYFCTVAPATTAHYPCPPKYCGTHPLWYEPRQHVSFRARAMIWVDTENVCTWDRTVGRRVFAGINCSRHGRRCDDRQHRNATNAVKTARTKKQNATAEAHRRRSRPPRDGRPLAASAVHAARPCPPTLPSSWLPPDNAPCVAAPRTRTGEEREAEGRVSICCTVS